MTWETIIENTLQGISNFVTTFISLIGGSINPEAAEGLIAVFAIVLIYRVAQGGRPKIPKIKRKDEDDEEYEYVMIRRRK